jgi:hypothetical protein
MADYIITLDDEDNEYDVRADTGVLKYNIGVSYEIPTKSTQYSNLLLDNFSASFNGSTQTFPLTVNGDPYFPLNDQQLIISINDVVLSPGVDYQITGSDIYFTNPPLGGQQFFGVAPGWLFLETRDQLSLILKSVLMILTQRLLLSLVVNIPD